MRIPKRVEAWAQAMRKSAKGRQVLKNLEAEQNVPRAVSTKFFQAISKDYDPAIKAPGHMVNVLASTDGCSLSGPDAELGLRLLSRFA